MRVDTRTVILSTRTDEGEKNNNFKKSALTKQLVSSTAEETKF